MRPQVLQSCGSPELVRSVISPHFSKDTVDFLRGHLTPKETTIFELLGDGWTKPRAEWPREQCAPPYHPKFRNGWEPPLELLRTAAWETEGPMGPLGSPTSPDYRKHTAEDYYGTQSSNSSNGSYNGMPPTRKYAKIRYHFVARNANELSVLQDEILEAGYVPVNILDLVKIEDPDGVYNQPGYSTSPPGSLSHGDSFKNRPKDKMMDEVNNELLMMITANKSQLPARKFRVERSSSTHVPLTFDSSQEQVTAWLSAKSFSKQTVKCLGILTGAQLFSLNKEELKAVCGEESGRVYLQATVQKEQLEKNSGDSELQEIMTRRQQRIDSGNQD
ncbi:Epidermal growth factor receptor kinase substrate 8-like protein 2 [Liparis tanakae]|uniref:Epidermal growth factor receptor kinase substrate 8-like protein 2 n=1 Tax=Liparis tanakae TaxID=230148 RepID=A0A4Z2J9H2_9TELE|nr:Epidermal growth factor receptor kinase substrate 8-like protein 2 [Liparis tanakae]